MERPTKEQLHLIRLKLDDLVLYEQRDYAYLLAEIDALQAENEEMLGALEVAVDALTEVEVEECDLNHDCLVGQPLKHANAVLTRLSAKSKG